MDSLPLTGIASGRGDEQLDYRVQVGLVPEEVAQRRRQILRNFSKCTCFGQDLGNYCTSLEKRILSGIEGDYLDDVCLDEVLSSLGHMGEGLVDEGLVLGQFLL